MLSSVMLSPSAGQTPVTAFTSQVNQIAKKSHFQDWPRCLGDAPASTGFKVSLQHSAQLLLKVLGT